MKSQNCPNLSMAMKALLFVFSNTVIRLGFLYAFLSSSISAKENLLCFLQHNTNYVSNEASFSCRIICGNYLGGKSRKKLRELFLNLVCESRRQRIRVMLLRIDVI